MAGKSSGDRRKPRKGAKNAAPAKSIRVGVIDYKDVATLRKFVSERGGLGRWRRGTVPSRAAAAGVGGAVVHARLVDQRRCLEHSGQLRRRHPLLKNLLWS